MVVKSSMARGHQTQWAAQFAVASELCKRGYEVALTLGHTTPDADLMVVSPIEALRADDRQGDRRLGSRK
jgi:hypothetical protein